MAIEVWQMVQMKRVLDAFCSRNQVEPDDDAALKACNDLLRSTQPGIDDADELFDHLCNSIEKS